MFLIRRTISQINRNSVREIRLFCSAGTKFKNKNVASLDERPQIDENNRQSQEDGNKQSESTQESSKNENDDEQTRETDRNLMIRGNFEYVSNKNRETFLSMIHMFVNRDVHRRNQVEFIYAALKQMREFGVNKDLEVYKALIDILPKGKYIATNVFQAEFMHYPKQQNCIIFLLDQMEYNNVLPDEETQELLYNIFGRRAHPVYKLWRMMYWMPKFRYLNPWLLPNPLPNEALELAKIAVRQMCTVDVESVVETFETKDVEGCLDKTWIVSGQSPEQKKILSAHSKDSPLKVEGPFKIQLRNVAVTYFTLVGDAEPNENFESEGDPDGKFTHFVNISYEFINEYILHNFSMYFRCAKYRITQIFAIYVNKGECR